MIAWKGRGRKWTIESAKNVGIIAIRKMDTKERAELAQYLHTQFVNRVNQFAKAGRVGYAMVKLVGDMEKASSKLGIHLDPFDNVVNTKGKMRYLSSDFANRSNPQNALASYISMMQDFFGAKSASVKGWKLIGEQQDKRLFGTEKVRVPNPRTKRGYSEITRVKYEMTDAERIIFWKVYKELKDSGWTAVDEYSSESQRMLASQWMKGDFNHLDFEEAYHKMQELLDATPDVLTEHVPGRFDDPFQPEGEGLEDDFLVSH